MNKATVFVIAAMLLYSAANVALDMKFSKLSSLTIMMVYSVPIFLVGFLGRIFMGAGDPALGLPTGTTLTLLILLGIVIAAADLFYVSAYTHGGSMLMITTVMMLFPAVALLMKFGLTQSLPNGMQLGGYALAAVGVYLIAKGTPVTT
jgi:hypothetical protein